MGVGEVNGPPKKKLKQAQLTFSTITPDKAGNKRKLSPNSSPEGGLAVRKVSRKESISPKLIALNKENVKVNPNENAVVEILSDEDEKMVSGTSSEGNRDTSEEKVDGVRDDNCSLKAMEKKEVAGSQVGEDTCAESSQKNDVKKEAAVEEGLSQKPTVEKENYTKIEVREKVEHRDTVQPLVPAEEREEALIDDVTGGNKRKLSPNSSPEGGLAVRKVSRKESISPKLIALNKENVKVNPNENAVVEILSDEDEKMVSGTSSEGNRDTSEEKVDGVRDDNCSLKAMEKKEVAGSQVGEDTCAESSQKNDVKKEAAVEEGLSQKPTVEKENYTKIEVREKVEHRDTVQPLVPAEEREEALIDDVTGGNKRKLSPNSSPEGGLAVRKVSRKESISPKLIALNKENVKVNPNENAVVETLSDVDEKTVSETSGEGHRDTSELVDEVRDDVCSLKAMEKKEVTESQEGEDACAESSQKNDEMKQAVVEEGLSQIRTIEKEKVEDPEKVELDDTVKPLGPAEDGDEALIDGVKKVLENNPVRNQKSDDVTRSRKSSLAKDDVAGEPKCLDSKISEGENEPADQNVSNDILEQSIDSDQGDFNASICLSSDNETDVSSLSTKKGLTTPSSLKKADRIKFREEKIRLKKERDDLKRQKKEEKERKKQEELKMKEEARKRKEGERKRREEAKEEERKRKEEDRKRKEEEERKRREAKEEERRKKEEEKKKKEEFKEEDRRKKEEARLAEERKESLAKMAFTKFFIQNKSKTCIPKEEDKDKPLEGSETPKFMPFPVKADMRLAVQVRHSICDKMKNVLSTALHSGQPSKQLYLYEIKRGLRKPWKTAATWPLSEEQHDVIIVESVSEEKAADIEEQASSFVKPKRQRAKLIQFHDNRRPPYWGTWRKKSLSITPRRPFGKDQVFDYEVDSDSEWEDEDEGEDIDKEGESDKEQSDDENVGEHGYLLDNTFVPHGYLSDEEAAEEENLDPEDQKLKMKALKQEFEQELKSKAERLKPRLLGCVWICNETAEVSKGSLYETLMNYRCKWDEGDGSIDPSGPAVVEATPPSLANAKFPSSMIEHLVKLVHGSRLSHINLVKKFIDSLDSEKHLSTISKRAVSLKIKDIAQKTPNSSSRLVWTVTPELCAEYNLPNVLDSPKTSPATSEISHKPKDTTLVNFLKKGSTPQRGAKKRLIPTLVSPLVNSASKDEKPTHLSASDKKPTNSITAVPSCGPTEIASDDLENVGASYTHEPRKYIIPTSLSPLVNSSSTNEKPTDSSTSDGKPTKSSPADPSCSQTEITSADAKNVGAATHEPQKRIIPTLVPTLVNSTSIAEKPSNTLASDENPINSTSTEPATPSTDNTQLGCHQKTSTSAEPKKLIVPTLLSPAVNSTTGTKNTTISQTVSNLPPVRKRIAPITLSKTVSKPTRTIGSSPKIHSFFSKSTDGS